MSRIGALLACALVLSMLVACGGNFEAVPGAQAAAPLATEGAAAEADDELASPADTGTDADDGNVASQAGTGDGGAGSVAAALAANGEASHAGDAGTWDDSTAVEIALEGGSVTVAGSGDGVLVDGSQVAITSAGTYRLTGTLAEGQIVVDTEDEELVRLILNGVEINNSSGAPIYVMNAKEVAILLAEGTANLVSDGDRQVSDEEDAPNAAIFSMADLTIAGDGSLTVAGNANDGIASKDGLVIAGGTIDVTAADDGIRGKDYVVVQNGDLTVVAQGDGLKADNEEDSTLGYILIEDGTIEVTAGGDAVEAQTDLMVSDGELSLSSGGGSSGRIDASASAKGLKASAGIIIDGGVLTIDSADDAINSNGSLFINGGTFVISSGDDAMHADATLEINGGRISILDSFEGLESAAITINDGEVHVVASDDGLNVAGGNDSSGLNVGPGLGGGPAGRPGRDTFAPSGNYYLRINGGTVVVYAAGDGLDVNGSITMTDGLVIVHGPTENMNGALDYDRSFTLGGGLLVAAGSSGMAQAPDTSSTQYSVLLNLDSAVQAGTLIHIESSEGDEVVTFAPAKVYQSIVFSSAELEDGATYNVSFGGSSSGTAVDGLYTDGAYTSGSLAGSFTISGIVTALGNSARR